MLIKAVRRIQFCAGHRVFMHESKCHNIHGHNYVAYIHTEAEKLDRLGRVIDFGIIKRIVGAWIEEYWDHGFIYYKDDVKIKRMLECVGGTKSFSLTENPTAENMAKYLMEKGNELLNDFGVSVVKVVLHETENCFVECEEIK